mgnify:FL=1
MIEKRMIMRHPHTKECDGIPIAYRGIAVDKLFGSEAKTLMNGAPRCGERGIALCACEYAYGHECE